MHMYFQNFRSLEIFQILTFSFLLFLTVILIVILLLFLSFRSPILLIFLLILHLLMITIVYLLLLYILPFPKPAHRLTKSNLTPNFRQYLFAMCGKVRGAPYATSVLQMILCNSTWRQPGCPVSVSFSSIYPPTEWCRFCLL